MPRPVLRLELGDQPAAPAAELELTDDEQDPEHRNHENRDTEEDADGARLADHDRPLKPIRTA